VTERLALLNQFLNPVEAIGQSMRAGERMMQPNMGGYDRLAAMGDMLSGVAGVAGPAVAAGRAGLPAAAAIIEGLLGGSPTTQAAGDMARQFGVDESGAFRLYQGSPHNFNAERLVRYPDGRTEYIVGRPDVLPDVPAGAEVLQDFPLGRQRMDKIGTGEGAQAYGYGLYGAEAEGVASNYKGVQGMASADPMPNVASKQLAAYGDTPKMREFMRLVFPKASGDQIEAAIATAKNPPSGRMYELNINANPEDFLDWDLPLGEQPQVLQRLGLSVRPEQEIHDEAFRLMTEGNQREAGKMWFDFPEIQARVDALQGELDRRAPNMTGEEYYRGGGSGDVSNILSQMGYGDPAVRSQELREAGIPGIRYLDAGSRGAADVNELRGTVSMWTNAVNKAPNDNYAWKMLEDADAALKQAEANLSRNYVIFDENLIEIVRKYGIAGAAAMLGISQADVAQAMQQQQPQPRGLLGAQ
jgi:hypothetical protein